MAHNFPLELHRLVVEPWISVERIEADIAEMEAAT